MGWTRHWPVARASLISLVIVVGLIDGCPLPATKQTPASLKPTVKLLRDGRQEVMKLVRPVREGFKLHQQWKLFPTANLRQHRLWVEGRTQRGQPWEIMYRPHDPEHDFLQDPIEYRRMRGAWNPGKNARRGYSGFARWVAGEVFEARPDINDVRVRLENIRVVPKEGRFESLGKFQFEKTRRRQVQQESQVVEPEQAGEAPEP